MQNNQQPQQQTTTCTIRSDRNRRFHVHAYHDRSHPSDPLISLSETESVEFRNHLVPYDNKMSTAVNISLDN